MKIACTTVLVFLLGLFSPAITAAPLFSIDITVGDRTRTFFFSDVRKVFDQIDEDQLRMEFPNYTDMSQARAVVDFRGVPMNFSFAQDSNDLVFEVLNMTRTFKGATRDASVDALEEFLKKDDDDLLNEIQAASIASSPVDPIAGNPGSMMGLMVAGQFEAGFSSLATNIAGTPAAPGPDGEADSPDNLIHIAPTFGRYTASDQTSNVLTLPLGYSVRFREGGEGLRSIDLSLPLTYAEIEGAKSAAAYVHTGLTWGLTEQWTLTPAVGLGLAGSVDLGAGGGIGSTSLTSGYTIPFDKYSLHVGNMVGYYRTLDITVGDYSFDPGISNTVLRNGLMVSVPWTLGSRKVAIEFRATDTRFFGSELYSEYNDEFGISLGTVKTEGRSIENYLRAGVSFLTGDNVKGWRVNFVYSF